MRVIAFIRRSVVDKPFVAGFVAGGITAVNGSVDFVVGGSSFFADVDIERTT